MTVADEVNRPSGLGLRPDALLRGMPDSIPVFEAEPAELVERHLPGPSSV